MFVPRLTESEKNLHESSLFRIDAAVQTCMEATRTPTPHTYITPHQGMRARAQTQAMNRRGVQNHPLLTCKECSIEWILNSYHNNRLPRTKNSSNHQSGRYKTRRVQFAFRLSRTTTRTNGKIAIAPEREVLIAQKIGEVQFLSSTAFI